MGQDVPAQWDQKNLIFTPNNVTAGRELSLVVDFGAKSSIRTIDLPDNRIDDYIKIVADGRESICSADVNADTISGQREAINIEDSVDSQNVQTSTKSEDLQDKNGAEWKSRYKGKQVKIQCKENIDYTDLAIYYKHEASRTNRFKAKLPEGVNPDGTNIAWKVYIDGSPTTQFKRSGTEVEIEDDLLPPETRVDVEVITYTQVAK